MLQIGCKKSIAYRKFRLHKPKCAKLRCKMFDDFRTHSNLDRLNGRKEYSFQLFVKIITIHHIVETASRFELMCQTVDFHKTPIVSQTEITDDVQNSFCLYLIINNQPTFLQYVYLLRYCYCLFRISIAHKQKMSRWVRCSNGKRAGFVDAKLSILLQ